MARDSVALYLKK